MSDQLERINELRSKVDELKAEKERLAGRIETQEKSLTVMETECKEKFGCEIEELESMAEQLDTEVDGLISEVEKLLEGKTNG